MPDATRMEPFRADTVLPLAMTTRRQREDALARAGLNLYRLPADVVTIDLLTDSGAGAVSVAQRARMLHGDEAYAGSASFELLRSTLRRLSGFDHVIPVPQGRAAERILCQLLVTAGDVVPANTHFNTTRANVETMGARAVDLPTRAARQPSEPHPFKGDFDVAALREVLAGEVRVPCVVATITDNSGGGQPMSMANLRDVSALCEEAGVPLLLDACRFAENAFLVSQREAAHAGRPADDVARDAFDLADGAWVSAKKDGLSPIGGVLLLRDDELAERSRDLLMLSAGLPSYGGLSGAALEAMAQGFVEALDDAYLAHRVGSIARLAERLEAEGVPTLRPAGGHAAYVDAGALLPHLSGADLPAQALAVEMFLRGGVRCAEVGTVMFGRRLPDGTEEPWSMELLRLAVPRRTYSSDHLEYVVQTAAEVAADRDAVAGLRFASQPAALRHFTATFERLPAPRRVRVTT
jgi:tryptophanase